MENVKLVELNSENWYECCQLEIMEDQSDFIEPNAISIIQSKFEAYVIYCEKNMVGFLMYNSVHEELDGYWIYRIMIDKRWQGKGIGKEATKLMISKISSIPNAKKIVVGYHPENIGAHSLYASLGFVNNGDRFGREMAVIKRLN